MLLRRYERFPTERVPLREELLRLLLTIKEFLGYWLVDEAMFSCMMRDPEWFVFRAKVLLAKAATAVPDLILKVELTSKSPMLL
jgi:hypothetical protein